MSDAHATRGLRLAPQEFLFLGAVVLIWTGFVLWLGKDTSWDFRNYHWYIPYALLNHRMGFDVAVAHQATYYNPFLDVPFYWLAIHTSSWFAIAVLGMVQGANIVPLYLIARQSLSLEEYKLGAAALALLGMTGGLSLGLYGTHYYDNVMSVAVLSSIAILIARRETLAQGALRKVAAITAIAGFLTGAAVGLKLPEAPFAIGFAVALMVIGGDAKHLATRLVAGALGGLVGIAVFGGYWMLKLDALTGNPLFPYFNQYFHSSLALNAPYRDMRFLPTSFKRAVAFPILFSMDWAVADDLPYLDIRVGLAYVATIIAMACWLLRARAKEPLLAPRAVAILFAFAAGSYIAWLKIFAIYRYIVALEMLAPILIAASIGLLPLARRTQLVALAALFFIAMVFTRGDFMDRAPLGDPYITTSMPRVQRPGNTVVLMTGNAPLGFMVPSLPPQVPVLRIDGWMMQPRDGTGLTRVMKQRVKAHVNKKDDLFLLADAYDMNRARDALADYDLRISWLKCTMFDTNLGGGYQWCPLIPWPKK